jgi:hypothetical protein
MQHLLLRPSTQFTRGLEVYILCRFEKEFISLFYSARVKYVQLVPASFLLSK